MMFYSVLFDDAGQHICIICAFRFEAVLLSKYTKMSLPSLSSQLKLCQFLFVELNVPTSAFYYSAYLLLLVDGGKITDMFPVLYF